MIIDESIDTSDDDSSMLPFYVHKLKPPLTNISNGNENRNIIVKKKLKQNGPTAAVTNQQHFKLAKTEEINKIQIASKNRLSMIQSKPKYSLSVNDLYAILSPIIKPFIYNHGKFVTTSSYIFNCNYVGTIHIPYDTLNNAPKLSSIRSSIEYFLTTPKTDEKTVCLSIYRDSLMIRELIDHHQFMCFTSTQIGFCGKMKQLNDYFAIIIMSIDQATSSSCLLFKLNSNEIQKLDLILNLISKIYRNQNYVFNNHQTLPPPPIVSSSAAIATSFSDTIIATNLNKKHFNSKLNDINENDELCLSLKSKTKNSLINTKPNTPLKTFQRNTENTQSIKVIKENLTNLFLSKFNNNQQPTTVAVGQNEIKQKTMSLPHNYNLLQVKQDLIVTTDSKKKQENDGKYFNYLIIGLCTP